MKQPLENLTLIYINKKPIDFWVKIWVITLPLFWLGDIIWEILILTGNSKPIIDTEFILFEEIILFILIVIIAVWCKNIISNFIEDKKGAVDYIGYDNNFIQFRLPYYKIINPFLFDSYFLRKIEENILINNIQSIRLKNYLFQKTGRQLSNRQLVEIILTTHNKSYKLLALIEINQLKHFINQIEQFANSKNISIKSFRY
ncbi:MAG: hypothetical protein IKH45_02010 [Neisseriaceae bacterium]|nr:hypothetical protein [Neisseriaceae bacterium]